MSLEIQFLNLLVIKLLANSQMLNTNSRFYHCTCIKITMKCSNSLKRRNFKKSLISNLFCVKVIKIANFWTKKVFLIGKNHLLMTMLEIKIYLVKKTLVKMTLKIVYSSLITPNIWWSYSKVLKLNFINVLK